MINYLNFVEGLFGISCGIWCILYLSGKLNLSDEQEERRKAKVEKYGWILGTCALALFACSFLLILGSF